MSSTYWNNLAKLIAEACDEKQRLAKQEKEATANAIATGLKANILNEFGAYCNRFLAAPNERFLYSYDVHGVTDTDALRMVKTMLIDSLGPSYDVKHVHEYWEAKEFNHISIMLKK